MTQHLTPADIREMFDRDAGLYYALKYGRGADAPQQYAFALRQRLVVEMLFADVGRPRHVLDVGCGPGVMIEPVLAHGGRLTGVDLSPAMVARAEARAQALGASERCRFSIASAERLPFSDGAFDAVTAMGVVEYVADDGRALREMARVVRPGGAVIVTVPNLLSPWRLAPVLLKGLLPPPLKRIGRRMLDRARGETESKIQNPKSKTLQLDRFPRRLYFSWTLRQRMAAAGLRPREVVYYNFRLPMVGTLWPRGSVRLAAALAPLGRSPALGWLAGGCIAKALKNGVRPYLFMHEE
jgi:SAM-dependent methyltransferase